MPKMFSAAVLTAALVLSAGVFSSSSTPAFAFNLNPSRPQQACAPFAQDMSLPGLWLGHFTGGRLARVAQSRRALEWRDDYACFPTHAACDVWQRGLLRQYGSVEGYRTCLPLRGGGVRIRSARGAHVVIAKY
ncbi:MAG TPA: hypothetical protein VMU56_02100 [Beijerinckiaceae bacterium]|nr:hypothetical protein [Beijerinckiaceae bacterium]